MINKIMHDDVIDGLKKIEDDSVSLVFTSPPYNVDIKYGNHDDTMPYTDYLDWLKDIWSECYRALRPGGRLVINIDSMVNHEEDRFAKKLGQDVSSNDIVQSHMRTDDMWIIYKHEQAKADFF